MNRFHAHSGWFFSRAETGAVTISYEPSPEQAIDSGANATAPDVTATFDDSTWASIVAFASARGETGDTYREALAFHNASPDA